MKKQSKLMWILEEQVIAEIRERFLFLVLLPLIMPVSYTHLDVYKRQGRIREYPILRSQTPLSRSLRKSHGNMVWIMPVSYTHLDVYKRQVIIINCNDAVLTGKKLDKKFHRTHSGWIGGLKETQYLSLIHI